ncbi:MAG: hypothetical protein R6X25_11530 [Candidatus Krumholzibacteriia bacterium]
MGLVVCIMVISAAAASANVPSLTLSTATTAAAGPVALFNLPNGTGNAFTAARAAPPSPGTAGPIVDATVTLTLLDGNGDPISNYPGEDLWLGTTSSNFFACNNGTIADFNTNAAGQTVWVDPMLAGGFSLPGTDVTKVYVNGAPLAGAGMAISFNSADIFPDGRVNSSDVAAFAGDYFAAYNFRSDMYYDGVVNASDVAAFANGFGAACPGL